jgi:hypothetical protein
MRLTLVVPLVVSALLGQGLHILNHHAVEPCAGHLDGAHFGRVVHAEPDCPFCAGAGVTLPAAAFVVVFVSLSAPRPAAPAARTGRCVANLRTRAPPR